MSSVENSPMHYPALFNSCRSGVISTLSIHLASKTRRVRNRFMPGYVLYPGKCQSFALQVVAKRKKWRQRELCFSLWGLFWVLDSCKCYWIDASLRDLCNKRVGLRERICWSPSTHWSQSAPAELQRNQAVQVKMKETHCLTAAIPCWWM